jgi:acetyl-CoA acyltransferase
VTTRRSVVIAAAARSPFGRRDGSLAAIHPVDLGAAVLEALLARSGCDARVVDGVIVGCASPVGEQALGLARHVARAGGLGDGVPGTTVDAQCASGLRAVQLACEAVAAGTADVVVAGGVESMSRVPFGSALLLGGDPFGARLSGHLPAAVPQGVGAERAAARSSLSRAALDEWAARSHVHASAARDAGLAAREIVAVGDATADDEVPVPTVVALGTHAPGFEQDGVVTAGNSAPIADGAALVLVVAQETADARGLPVLARVAGSGSGAGEPDVLGAALASVTGKMLDRARLAIADVDRVEVGEQYAVIPLAWAAACGVPLERVNPQGGAIALGHPVGATGAQLVVTLAQALGAGDSARGLAAMAAADGGCHGLLLERVAGGGPGVDRGL